MTETESIERIKTVEVTAEDMTNDVAEKGVIIRGTNFNPTANEIDLYGNIQLHHSVSHSNPDISNVKSLLVEFPEGAEKQNQFGRIPLHYVLDRANTSLSVTKLLLKFYPEGASLEDNEGNTPYDLALHWHHPKKVLRALLRCGKTQDIEMWRRLEYGFLYDILYCFCCWHRTGGTDGGGISGNDDAGDQQQSQSLVKQQNSFEGYPENSIIPFSDPSPPQKEANNS